MFTFIDPLYYKFMRFKLKKLLLLSSFGLLFGIVGCELQEDVVEKHNHEQKFKLY